MALLNKKLITVDQAIAGLTKIVNDLQKVVEVQTEQSSLKASQAELLKQQADEHAAEATRAAQVAEKFGSMFS